MRKVIINTSETINLNDIHENTPIFVKDKEGKLIGMVIKEDEGWVLRMGGPRTAMIGSLLLFSTRKELIELLPGFDFFVN